MTAALSSCEELHVNPNGAPTPDPARYGFEGRTEFNITLTTTMAGENLRQAQRVELGPGLGLGLEEPVIGTAIRARGRLGVRRTCDRHVSDTC